MSFALFDVDDELSLSQANYHDVLDVFREHGGYHSRAFWTLIECVMPD